MVPEDSTEPMKRVSLEIYHWDCSNLKICKKYPDIKFFHKDCLIDRTPNKVIDRPFVRICGPDTNAVKEFRAEYMKNPRIKSGNLLYLKEGYCEATHLLSRPRKTSIINIFVDNAAIETNERFLMNDKEFREIICPASSIGTIVDSLSNIGIVKIARIVDNDKVKQQLTPAQQLALSTAIRFGYYSWPRKITLAELAEKISLSRRGFQDNLRKAEEKVMNKWPIDIGR